jgi:Zn-dependent protease with chaperone function
MTLASAVPLALYTISWILLDAGDEDDDENPLPILALVTFALYLVSEFVMLWLSRTRELAADHWSCASTGKATRSPPPSSRSVTG